MKVNVIGAGFSALSLSYFLTKIGVEVEIYETASEAGGLLSTQHDELGLIEKAANGLYNTSLVEELFSDLKIDPAQRKPTAKNRYIFRGSPKKWPLSIPETFWLVLKFGWNWMIRRHAPQSNETISEWATRVGGQSFANFMLAPALQGIYAGDIRRMSSELVLGRFFRKQNLTPPSVKGTVAPVNGMRELTEHLVLWLKDHGVRFHFESSVKPSRPFEVSTGIRAAADYLREFDAELSQKLAEVQTLPLLSVTAFFSEDTQMIRGFGCLFPESEGFHSLGVLFNSDIFGGRSKVRSETWILGGAQSPQLVDASDDEIIEKILKDRARLPGSASVPLKFVVTRWPSALPHYDLKLKAVLDHLRLPNGIFLTGNYLGQIGLSRILQFNQQLALDIQRMHT